MVSLTSRLSLEAICSLRERSEPSGALSVSTGGAALQSTLTGKERRGRRGAEAQREIFLCVLCVSAPLR
jgi:hypothetical protein